MAKKPASDRLESPRRRPTLDPTQSAVLPVNEPEDGSLTEKRKALARSLEELESTFRYMGRQHPQYERTEKRLQDLRMMLEQLDRSIASGQA